jgi:hypothetical protein
MKLYKGLVKFDKKGKIEDIVVVDDSFSWKAFFFNPLWFLFHKMWIEFFLFLSVLVVFIYVFSFGAYNFLMQISLLFMIALNSKTWYEDFLVKRKNYLFLAMIFGNNKTEAKIKFINQISLKNKENNEKIIFSDNLLDPKYFK